MNSHTGAFASTPPSRLGLTVARTSPAWLLVLVWTLGWTGEAKSQNLESDKAVLEALYDATGGDNWKNNTNWKSNQPVADWHGVSVDNGRVTVLNLGGNQLTGSIPPQLGNLANLTVLNLSRNEGLTGPLPNSLRHLSKLEILNASGTDLHAPSDPAFQAWLASITYNGVPPKAEVPTLDFAHFANGSSWITDLVFVNLETQPSGPPLSPIVYFYGTNGESLAPESVVDIMGDLEVTEDSGLTVRTAMAPLAVLTISTHGRGDLITGSVRVVSDGLLGGMLRFAHPGIGEAVVGASLPSSDAIFPVRRQEGGITTAVAIHNLESSPELVRCDLKREGVLLDSVMIPLEANGQTSWSLETAFPAPDTSAFLGSVRCVAVGEGLFTAIALEMDPTTRTFITLPVMSVPEMPSPE